MTNMWLLTLTTLLVMSGYGAYGDVSVGESTERAVVGENVQLLCKNADSEVQWVFDGPFGEIIIADTPPFSLTPVQNQQGYQMMLSIDEVTTDDAGDYICRSTKTSGDQQIVSLYVTSEESAPPVDFVLPTIDLGDGDNSMEVEAGKELRLRCVGGGSSVLQIHHNGKAIVEDTHNFITRAQDINTNGETVLLTRVPAMTAYSGTYTCFDTAFPDMTRPVEVTVVDHPSTDVELFEPSGKQTKVMIGDNFQLKCQSSLNTDILWYHDDDQLQDEVDGFLITTVIQEGVARKRTTILMKQTAEASDAGTYRCVNAGSPEKEASIVVAVKTEGKDGNILDAIFGGATCMTSSVLLLLLAALCTLI